MTDERSDDDDVTVPGDHELIAELRRSAADETTEVVEDDDLTVDADTDLVEEIRREARRLGPLPPPVYPTAPALPPPTVAPVEPAPTVPLRRRDGSRRAGCRSPSVQPSRRRSSRVRRGRGCWAVGSPSPWPSSHSSLSSSCAAAATRSRRPRRSPPPRPRASRRSRRCRRRPMPPTTSSTTTSTTTRPPRHDDHHRCTNGAPTAAGTADRGAIGS